MVVGRSSQLRLFTFSRVLTFSLFSTASASCKLFAYGTSVDPCKIRLVMIADIVIWLEGMNSDEYRPDLSRGSQ